jgi:phage replication O-like protein O
MAAPQIEYGYTRIPNKLFDELCRIRIPGEARQVLDTIFRKTYGWNRKCDQIPLNQFVKMTGIARRNVVRAIKILEAMNLIFVERKNTKVGGVDNDTTVASEKTLHSTTTYYGINENYDSWAVSKQTQGVVSKTTQGVV